MRSRRLCCSCTGAMDEKHEENASHGNFGATDQPITRTRARVTGYPTDIHSCPHCHGEVEVIVPAGLLNSQNSARCRWLLSNKLLEACTVLEFPDLIRK